MCAEEYAGKCGDHIIVGRLYSVKSVLYNTIFDFKQAINQAHLASEYFLKGGDTTRYLNNLTNVAVIIYNSGSNDSAASFNKPVDGRILCRRVLNFNIQPGLLVETLFKSYIISCKLALCSPLWSVVYMRKSNIIAAQKLIINI